MKRISREDLQALYAPADEPFMQAVERALSSLPEEKEKIIMKKKLSLGVVLAIIIALTTVTALAASQWARIQEFMGLHGTVARLEIRKDGLAVPTLRQNTSQWLEIQPTQAYWTTEGLHLTMHVSPRNEDQLVAFSWEIAGNGEEDLAPLDEMLIFIDQKPLAVGTWRQGREILAYDIQLGVEGWSYFQRDEGGESVILTLRDVDTAKMTAASEWTFPITAQNLITGEREESALTVQLPPMEQQEGRK